MRNAAIMLITLALALGLAGCKTNDGNPGDPAEKGFSKCLDHGDC